MPAHYFTSFILPSEKLFYEFTVTQIFVRQDAKFNLESLIPLFTIC